MSNHPPGDLTEVAIKLEVLDTDVKDIKVVLRELTGAIIKLALIEERLGSARERLDKGVVLIERMERRLAALEALVPQTKSQSKWGERVVWALLGLVAMFVAKKVGLIT